MQNPPKPIFKDREINELVYTNLIESGSAEWLAKILASRLDNPINFDLLFSNDLSDIEDPSSIPDMEIAVRRIVNAIKKEEKIVLVCDHDMDGTGSAAVLWTALIDFFKVSPSLVNVVTSHRLTEGYGITEPVAQRIIDIKPSLVISADKGSSDEPRINKIAEAGIDVIVTDHHEIGTNGPPQSAIAVVNPIRSDSNYDKHVCGAGVAFLTMAKVRTSLIQEGVRENIPSLAALLDYVAVATIADCVSMRPNKASINRTFVKRGLQLINNKTRPCWEVFCADLHGPVDAETIGFRLAPAVAAAGRLDWAEVGFKFLTSKNKTEAQKYWQELQHENALRKEIEKKLREKAIPEACKKKGQSIVLFLEDGHSGVHGITASRLVEAFGKPAAIFSPKGAGVKNGSSTDEIKIASGSFRGIPGFNVKEALSYVSEKHPGLLLSHGGHVGAGGGSVLISTFDSFVVAYEEAVNKQIGDNELKPIVWVDGELPVEVSDIDALKELDKLEPWGRDFPSPIFKGNFEVRSFQTLGDGSHLKLSLWDGAKTKDAIWFNAVHDGSEIEFNVGSTLNLVYSLKNNWYRNNKKIQLQIISKFHN
ncbi:MAG: DHH family phosphoesterase [Methylotenera sp.]|uniref:single-stranded-DNA-specific exonuclease RecJ n=1 Tax=Methylotenera sp. TaxID=2051956 RepID=UPI002731B06B|nr:DHH family phosphoesterase [Methylotenera sp.]MDP1522143.1 DHH family phosphoesterase [Methylotenera sp.]